MADAALTILAKQQPGEMGRSPDLPSGIFLRMYTANYLCHRPVYTR